MTSIVDLSFFEEKGLYPLYIYKFLIVMDKKDVLKCAVDLSIKIKELSERFGAVFEENPKAKFRHFTLKGDFDIQRNYIAIIREDQPEHQVYQGLSFVVFPLFWDDESNSLICVASIGIGLGFLGNDAEDANLPWLKRVFSKLRKFSKGDIEYPSIPFLKENFADTIKSNDALFNQLSEIKKTLLDKGQTNEDKNLKLDLLQPIQKSYASVIPAGIILKFTPDEISKINDPSYYQSENILTLRAWLAQYAKYRDWASNNAQRNSIKEAINKVSVTLKTFDKEEREVANLLKQNKYIVLQGAPGTGKTFLTDKLCNNKVLDNSSVAPILKIDKHIFTQFHAETTYSDFVGGIRPALDSSNVKYEYEEGPFTEAILAARKRPSENVLLIIDEINRANLANVLGPVFYLFEKNAISRTEEIKIKTKEKQEATKDYFISLKELPENLYVVATMNTADKSLAVLDFALRRRFIWYTLIPTPIIYNEGKQKELGDNEFVFDDKYFNKFCELFEKYASDEELNLQPGQSYFIVKKKDVNDGMKQRLKYELMPLMKEYFAAGFLNNMIDEFASFYLQETNEEMYK